MEKEYINKNFVEKSKIKENIKEIIIENIKINLKI